MLPRPRVLPRHLQRLMPLETCRLIDNRGVPRLFLQNGIPRFPEIPAKSGSGRNPRLLYIPNRDRENAGFPGQSLPPNRGRTGRDGGFRGLSRGRGPRGGGDFNLKSGVWVSLWSGSELHAPDPGAPGGTCAQPRSERRHSGTALHHAQWRDHWQALSSTKQSSCRNLIKQACTITLGTGSSG